MESPEDLGPPPSAIALAPASGRTDTLGEIANELDFETAQTLGQLASRWRRFVWRNHPDRQPIEARDRANVRVATANALYDRARRERMKGR
jgi:hypothetical protein